MAVARCDLSKTVFRLQGLHRKTETYAHVAYVLSVSLGDTPTSCIEVFSLATALSVHGSEPVTNVATLMFKNIVPAKIGSAQNQNEWTIKHTVNETVTHLILDTHFLGITPMNNVDYTTHQSEY